MGSRLKACRVGKKGRLILPAATALVVLAAACSFDAGRLRAPRLADSGAREAAAGSTDATKADALLDHPQDQNLGVHDSFVEVLADRASAMSEVGDVAEAPVSLADAGDALADLPLGTGGTSDSGGTGGAGGVGGMPASDGEAATGGTGGSLDTGEVGGRDGGGTGGTTGSDDDAATGGTGGSLDTGGNGGTGGVPASAGATATAGTGGSLDTGGLAARAEAARVAPLDSLAPQQRAAPADRFPFRLAWLGGGRWMKRQEVARPWTPRAMATMALSPG